MFSYFCCFRDQLDRSLIEDFYSINILSREASREVEAHEESHDRGPNRHGWRELLGRPRHQGPFAPRVSPCLHLLMYAFVSIDTGYPIFPIIFWGGGGGGTLLLPPKGLICCCRWREIAAIITANSSLA
jgi:hypothetical protein